ncbi:MAG: spore protease YyaC [Bacillota bacterium]|nr:spore protease YyaC [Bacillota bacterium]
MPAEIKLKQQYVDIKKPEALESLSSTLLMQVRKAITEGYKTIVFVCIGTDRSTGDSLGPLVGYKLANLRYKNIYLHGCLESPVHAKNLNETIQLIERKYENPFVVAIDACLGEAEHVGFISIGEGSIKPGSGVKKDLEPIGNMFITGIVNFGGFMDFIVLQNTRLSVVMGMADIISEGIRNVINKITPDLD